ncbi:MAG: hypothetical protein ACOC1G_00370 [Phycisphaeraceae bacterium]
MTHANPPRLSTNQQANLPPAFTHQPYPRNPDVRIKSLTTTPGP